MIQPVDTVGAGNTFCGYLASGLDQGMAFEEAFTRATTAASLVRPQCTELSFRAVSPKIHA